MQFKQTQLYGVGLTAIALFLSTQIQAIPLTTNPLELTTANAIGSCSPNTATSQPGAIGEFESCVQTTSTLELYKGEEKKENGTTIGMTDSGTFAGAYDTTFDVLDDAENASIALVSGATGIDPTDYSGLWAMAKDGAATPSWYAWDLLYLQWDGLVELWFKDPWNATSSTMGAISNVMIRGILGDGNDDPPSPPAPGVPVPAPLALLGLGGLMLGWITRKSRA